MFNYKLHWNRILYAWETVMWYQVYSKVQSIICSVSEVVMRIINKTVSVILSFSSIMLLLAMNNMKHHWWKTVETLDMLNVFIHVHTNVNRHINADKYILCSVMSSMYKHTNIQTHFLRPIQKYIHVHTYTHTYTYVCMYMHTYTCIHSTRKSSTCIHNYSKRNYLMIFISNDHMTNSDVKCHVLLLQT